LTDDKGNEIPSAFNDRRNELAALLSRLGELRAAVEFHRQHVAMQRARADLNGMGSEREARLMARLAAAESSLSRARYLLRECADSMEARPEDPGLQTMARACRRLAPSASPPPPPGPGTGNDEEAGR
jgi:hypothetical protein